MATKTIYFMVNGRPEQAEFPVDCPPLDIKGRDWCLGWQLCSHFKEKPRLDDCSQKITAGVSCCHRFNHSRLFWLVRKVAYGAAKVWTAVLWAAGRDAAAADSLSLHRGLRLRSKKTIHTFKPFCVIARTKQFNDSAAFLFVCLFLFVCF